MKNLSLVLNVVLLIAVAVLFYLHFSTGSASRGTAASESLPRDLKVAYINSDTVLKYYDYFKVNKEKLEAKGNRYQNELKSRAQALQNEFESYQRNASTLTMGQARAVEEDLGKKRQNLQLYQESLSQEVMVDQEKMTRDLYDRITNYLKKYGKEQGLQAVFKYDQSSDLLFGGDSLDISKIVIKGLNEQYKAEQVKTPADSTAARKKK